MNEEWKRKILLFLLTFKGRPTETPNKKKKMMNEQVFVTTSDTKTSKAISVDLETFAVSDVLSSLMGDSDDRRLIEGIDLRSTRTGQMFPFAFFQEQQPPSSIVVYAIVAPIRRSEQRPLYPSSLFTRRWRRWRRDRSGIQISLSRDVQRQSVCEKEGNFGRVCEFFESIDGERFR